MAMDINFDLFRAVPQNRNHVVQDRNVFRFDTKFEHVQQRSVRRSLDFDDDVNHAMSWGIRCVPLGHNAMFYLLRNSFPQYHEFEYDFVIVNGDGVLESGYGLRAFVGAETLCDEFLQ
uniref:Uncharacterized protein n=1 Tax=Acrobeloides nanus TaxID=290746 RepID=A0A914CD14_9BILA